MRAYLSYAMAAFGLVLLVSGCGGPEEKKAGYLAKAQGYIQEGNLPKARVALRNVLKIDPKDAEAYYYFAEVEEKEKNWKSAFENYQRVVDLAPDHERALIKLARFYLEARVTDRVVEIADKVLSKMPGQAQAETLKIAVRAISGDRAGALAAAETLIVTHPTDPDAATLLATLYLAQGRGQEAEPVMQRAVDANPQNLQLMDSFASALIRLEQYARAETLLTRIAEAEPKVFDHRLRLAGFYDERKDYDKAEKTLREVIRLDPDNEQRYLALAKFQVARRGMTEGEAVLTEGRRALPKSTVIQFALGELYELNRRTDQARSLYEAMRDEYRSKPTSLEAKVKLARLDWSDGKQDDAEKQLAEVLKENPRASEALLLRGKIALQRGDGKSAVQDFRSVLKDQPELAEAQALLGQAFLATSDPVLARESLEKAVGLNPRMVEAQMALAALDSSTGKLKDARARVEGLLKQDPNNLQTLSALLKLQAAERDWSATEQTMARARAAGADGSTADLTEGRLYQARGELDQARASFERALARYPDAPELLVALVQLDLQQKKPAQAKARLDQVLARNPNHPYAPGLLGEIALLGGNQAEAEARFREAMQRKPDWVQPWLHVATIKLTQKQSGEARDILENGLKAIPKSEELRLLLATTLSEAGQVDRAIQEYEELLRINPRALVAANNLASLLTDLKGDQKSLERALAIAKDFETTAPNPYFLDTLGWVHHKLGNSGQALHFIQQAAAKAPDHPVVNYHLGAAYFKAGQTSEAKIHLQKAIASPKPFPGLDDAKSVLAQLHG
jgi:tetratricopeptide (TPR) repeat protein